MHDDVTRLAANDTVDQLDELAQSDTNRDEQLSDEQTAGELELVEELLIEEISIDGMCGVY